MIKNIIEILKRDYEIRIINSTNPNYCTNISNNNFKKIKYIILSSIILFILSLFSTIYLLIDLRSQSLANEQMKKANLLQQEEISNLSKRVNSLQNTLDDLDSLAKQLQTNNNKNNNQGGPFPQKPTLSEISSSIDKLEYKIGNKDNVKEIKKKLNMAIYLKNNSIKNNTYIPSIWPTLGDISSPFGIRWNGTDYHPGIDIASDFNSPIRASADGVVEFAGYNSGGYGNMIDINHKNGYKTRYAHASSISVQSGQLVKRGDIIGYVGSTGFSTGPHLHYEVQINDKPIDPAGYMIYYN